MELVRGTTAEFLRFECDLILQPYVRPFYFAIHAVLVSVL